MHTEYAQITNQIFHRFLSAVQMCPSWMSDAYSSLCIQTDFSQCYCLPVAATHDRNLLQNDTIVLTVNSWSKSFCIVDKTVLHLHITLASFGMCLTVFQHSTAHMIINCHIHTVHFLLFLHQNCSLVTGSLRKLYF